MAGITTMSHGRTVLGALQIYMMTDLIFFFFNQFKWYQALTS